MYELSEGEFGGEKAKVEDINFKIDIKKNKGLIKVINKLGTFGAKVGKFFGGLSCSSTTSCFNNIIKDGVIPMIKPDLEAQVNEMMKETLKTLKADIKNMLPNGTETESVGLAYLAESGFSGTWKQCSYNTHAGEHDLSGTPFRGNMPGKGWYYDSTNIIVIVLFSFS